MPSCTKRDPMLHDDPRSILLAEPERSLSSAPSARVRDGIPSAVIRLLSAGTTRKMGNAG